MHCASFYHLYNLKNVKKTHGGVLLFKKHYSMGVFHVFLNCANGTKATHMSRKREKEQCLNLKIGWFLMTFDI